MHKSLFPSKMFKNCLNWHNPCLGYCLTTKQGLTMKTIAKISALAFLITVFALYQASASIVGVDLGTANPPATLGIYNMTPIEPGPLNGENGYAHETNGNDDGGGTTSWATWGQNYTGFVHVFLTDQSISFTLTGVHAIYFYEEPNQFADFTMTATMAGNTIQTIVNGFHGSSGIGFYATAGEFLTSVTITCSDTTGFAIGEFGIDNGTIHGGLPDGGNTVWLLGLAMVGICLIRRWTPARVR